MPNVPGGETLALAYWKLLIHVDWNDAVLVSGLREGLNKFLSNAHLSAYPGANKYHKTHYVSQAALERLRARHHVDLIWEHLVPKRRYIQEPCELQAMRGTLSIELVNDLLRRYWFLATITRDEDRLLRRTAMPHDWNGEAILSRYEEAGVMLVPNPFFDTLTARR